jgi:hypothetical protein
LLGKKKKKSGSALPSMRRGHQRETKMANAPEENYLFVIF